MSDTPLPTYVDARKAFKQEASVSGFVELCKLVRVAESAVEKDGLIQASLAFVQDSAGRRRIRGRVTGRLTLTCQRCLEPVSVDLGEELDLVLVVDEAAAQELDKEFDPWICGDHRLVLADILDEQLLLGMPIVSFHQAGPCYEGTLAGMQVKDSIDDSSAAADPSSPFAVLAGLKLD